MTCLDERVLYPDLAAAGGRPPPPRPPRPPLGHLTQKSQVSQVVVETLRGLFINFTMEMGQNFDLSPPF